MKTTTCSLLSFMRFRKNCWSQILFDEKLRLYNLNILHLSYNLGIIGKKKLMITLLILITYTCFCNTQGFVAEK